MAKLSRDDQLLQIAAGEPAGRKMELRRMDLQIGDASAQALRHALWVLESFRTEGNSRK